VPVISGQHSPQGKQEKILSKRHPAIPCGQMKLSVFRGILMQVQIRRQEALF